ncbi:MAG: metallophosphoesterase family protein [Firmicutes bacterium]|nr:metallophosphoesterase family protein [Bacillota bacterium]
MSGPLFIAGDIHGNAANAALLLTACREAGGRLLLLGDLLGHHRTAFSKGQPVEEQLAECQLSVLAVRGNCDTAFDEMLLPFELHDRLTLVEDGHTFLATHGHIFGEACPPRLPEGAVLLTGHTHIPAWREHGGWYYANPGSLGQPKGTSPAGYLVYAAGRFRWYDLAGQVWMEKEL